jgi:hypothetical protein
MVACSPYIRRSYRRVAGAGSDALVAPPFNALSTSSSAMVQNSPPTAAVIGSLAASSDQESARQSLKSKPKAPQVAPKKRPAEPLEASALRSPAGMRADGPPASATVSAAHV